ncbi:MAG: hypothetical protein QXD66_07355 [Candidatus Nezhaarchaeales archaeon]
MKRRKGGDLKDMLEAVGELKIVPDFPHFVMLFLNKGLLVIMDERLST